MAAQRITSPVRKIGFGRARLVLCLWLAALAFTACQATGQGWMRSNVPTQKATFGFVLDGATSTLSGSYHDPQGQVLNTSTNIVRTADVWFKGTGVVRNGPPPSDSPLLCPSDSLGSSDPGKLLFGFPTYDSQNPNSPGSGEFFLIVCDMGHGGTVGDFVAISVLSGPYAGYTNSGPVEGGNLTVS